MTFPLFEKKSLFTISDALEIAEDKTGNFYKFSFGEWKRHQYDVKTRAMMKQDEISRTAFARLNKGSRIISGFDSKTKKRDFYLICLQDHQILRALRRDNSLNLLPLLVYVFTHELVHIVRFCNFSQRFEARGQGREEEEKLVHETTYRILKDLTLPSMDYILDAYRDHRVCELGFS